MDDLPTSTKSGIKQNPAIPSTVGPSGGNKEVEAVGSSSVEPGIIDLIGYEQELPKEVSSAGVKTTPTTVKIPPAVSSLGVKPAGSSTKIGDGSSVKLPLTDDQIADGLNQSITSSWRWLAVWCIRKLKQLHFVVKMIRGKLTKSKS